MLLHAESFLEVHVIGLKWLVLEGGALPAIIVLEIQLLLPHLNSFKLLAGLS